MTQREINRLSAESIQDIDSMQAWVRNHELQEEQRLDQIEAAISTHRKKINRNFKLSVISIMWFGVVLAIVVLLFGVVQIVQGLF